MSCVSSAFRCPAARCPDSLRVQPRASHTPTWHHERCIRLQTLPRLQAAGPKRQRFQPNLGSFCAFPGPQHGQTDRICAPRFGHRSDLRPRVNTHSGEHCMAGIKLCNLRLRSRSDYAPMGICFVQRRLCPCEHSPFDCCALTTDSY